MHDNEQFVGVLFALKKADIYEAGIKFRHIIL